MQFSDGLIEDAIRVFKKENNVLFSKEEANEALNGLAGLFLAYAETDKRTSPQRLEACGEGANRGLTPKT